MVPGSLGYMLLPTMLVVCILSIVRKKVSLLWLIYPCTMGEPQDLTRPPYVWWICLGCTFPSKIMNVLPRYPWNFYYFMGYPWSLMWCTVFFLTSGSSLPCGSEVIIIFGFSKRFLLSFWLFFLGGGFAWACSWRNGFSCLGKPRVCNITAWNEGPPLLIWVTRPYWTP